MPPAQPSFFSCSLYWPFRLPQPRESTKSFICHQKQNRTSFSEIVLSYMRVHRTLKTAISFSQAAVACSWSLSLHKHPSLHTKLSLVFPPRCSPGFQALPEARGACLSPWAQIRKRHHCMLLPRGPTGSRCGLFCHRK